VKPERLGGPGVGDPGGSENPCRSEQPRS